MDTPELSLTLRTRRITSVSRGFSPYLAHSTHGDGGQSGSTCPSEAFSAGTTYFPSTSSSAVLLKQANQESPREKERARKRLRGGPGAPSAGRDGGRDGGSEAAAPAAHLTAPTLPLPGPATRARPRQVTAGGGQGAAGGSAYLRADSRADSRAPPPRARLPSAPSRRGGGR